MIDEVRARRLYKKLPEAEKAHVRRFSRKLEAANGKGTLQTELFVVDSMYRAGKAGMTNMEVMLPAIAVWHQDHVLETVGFQA